jgi:hypothetical protein
VVLEGHGQGAIGIDGLLAQGGEVGADGGGGLRPVLGAEAAGNLLLELGHTDVALGLVVIERDIQVGEEAQNRLAVIAQSPDQIVGGGTA